MKPSSIFPYSLIFIVSLLVFLNCASHTSADIINTTCGTCAQKPSSNFSSDFCYASLAAIPVSHTTNLGGLGLITLELALSNATNTAWIINSLLNNKSDPHCDSCLEYCFELYVDMSIMLDECISDFVSGTKLEAVHQWISEIMQAANRCEVNFKEKGKESPLTKENHNLSQLCGIAMCIIDLISPDLKSWSYLSSIRNIKASSNVL